MEGDARDGEVNKFELVRASHAFLAYHLGLCLPVPESHKTSDDDKRPMHYEASTRFTQSEKEDEKGRLGINICNIDKGT